MRRRWTRLWCSLMGHMWDSSGEYPVLVCSVCDKVVYFREWKDASR